jgi:hypothetical protein
LESALSICTSCNLYEALLEVVAVNAKVGLPMMVRAERDNVLDSIGPLSCQGDDVMRFDV